MECLIRIEFDGKTDPIEYRGGYLKPEDFVKTLNFDLGLWECISVLAAMTIIFRLLALIALRLAISKV